MVFRPTTNSFGDRKQQTQPLKHQRRRIIFLVFSATIFVSGILPNFWKRKEGRNYDLQHRSLRLWGVQERYESRRNGTTTATVATHKKKEEQQMEEGESNSDEPKKPMDPLEEQRLAFEAMQAKSDRIREEQVSDQDDKGIVQTTKLSTGQTTSGSGEVNSEDTKTMAAQERPEKEKGEVSAEQIEQMKAYELMQSKSLQLQNNQEQKDGENNEKREGEGLSRPVMYTYYEFAKTDMTEDANEDLLSNWKKAWYDEGWEPRILTEADARCHPQFDELIELILDPNHIGSYNMACYIRWIAMAAVGGGFMSDYDTFPLNPFLRHGRVLPFDGKLTVYSGFVPALVSGSGEEYLRITKRIGESIQKHVEKQKRINLYGPSDQHRQHLKWSDMLALKELTEKISTSMYVKRFEVLHGTDALQKEQWDSADCNMTAGMRAIHFSHKAIALGKQAYRGAVHRGTIARKFLNMWRGTCERTAVADN